MSKSMKKYESFEDYEEDFEEYDFDFGDERVDNNQTLVTPSVSATAFSTSPESDSAGNELNTKSHDLAGGDMLSSYESEYDYQEDYQDSSFSQNYDFRLFRQALDEVPVAKPKRYKNGTRMSLTFSNQRVREIDRANQILLEKIMRSGPSGDSNKRGSSSAGSQRSLVKSAAEVNRKKQQGKINYENQLLKRKLDKIAGRRPLV